MNIKSKVILLLVVILSLAPVVVQAGEKSFTGKVVSVIDGDTIEVLYSESVKGKVVHIPFRIRLQGIDCPESGQAYGKQAKQFVSRLCFGQQVKVLEHGEDRYTRTLGTVILPSGKNLNQELLRAGLAWHYRRYSANSTFQALEEQARRERRGLWQEKNPVPPWEYRRNQERPRRTLLYPLFMRYSNLQ